jgi:hypothetical protein
LPKKNAWDVYDSIKKADTEFQKDDIIILSCGPMGRVLACEWFSQNSNCTYLDLGSTFDPYTRNVWHNCHKGKLKFCKECNNEEKE